MSKVYAQQKKPHETAGVDSARQAGPAFSNQAMLDILKAPENVHAKSLSAEMNQRMSQHFGVSMNGLKVFENENLNQLGETAFAHGNEIHVAKGQFAPSTAHGQEILMHEAAHVVQQGMGLAHDTGNESAALEAQAQAVQAGGSMGSTAGFSMPTATAAAPVQGFGRRLLKKIKSAWKHLTEKKKTPEEELQFGELQDAMALDEQTFLDSYVPISEPPLSPHAPNFQPIRTQAEREANPVPYAERREDYKMDKPLPGTSPFGERTYISRKRPPAANKDLKKLQDAEKEHLKEIENSRREAAANETADRERRESAAWKKASALEKKAQADFVPIRSEALTDAGTAMMIEDGLKVDRTDELGRKSVAGLLNMRADMNQRHTQGFAALNTPEAMARRQPAEKAAARASDKLRRERISQSQKEQKVLSKKVKPDNIRFEPKKDPRKRLPLKQASRFDQSLGIEEKSGEEINKMLYQAAALDEERRKQKRELERQKKWG